MGEDEGLPPPVPPTESLGDPLPPPEGGPPAPPGTAEELFFQAEASRHRQVWEEAMRLYRFALQKSPDKPEFRYGLALAYEGKAKEPGYESYLHSAITEYRKIIASDPGWAKAHDALLAASLKADLLDDLLAEYQAKITAGKDVQMFKDTLRKIQALLILKAAPVVKATPPPPLLSFLLGFAAPGIGVVTLIAALIIRLKGGGAEASGLIAMGLMKLSLGGFLSFFCFKVYVYWRSTR